MALPVSFAKLCATAKIPLPLSAQRIPFLLDAGIPADSVSSTAKELSERAAARSTYFNLSFCGFLIPLPFFGADVFAIGSSSSIFSNSLAMSCIFFIPGLFRAVANACARVCVRVCARVCSGILRSSGVFLFLYDPRLEPKSLLTFLSPVLLLCLLLKVLTLLLVILVFFVVLQLFFLFLLLIFYFQLLFQFFL